MKKIFWMVKFHFFVLFFFLVNVKFSFAAINPIDAIQGLPHAVYNSQNNQFLMVWGECRSFPTLAPGQKGCRVTSTIYNSYSCSYGSTNASDIWGQIVNGDGSCFGGNFKVSREPDGQVSTGQELPSVTYNPDNHEYFVVWQGHKRDFVSLGDVCEGTFIDQGYDVFGQRISSGGQLIGPEIRISKLPNGNPLTDKDDEQWHPRVAYSTVDHVYMIVWHDGRTRKVFPAEFANEMVTFKDIEGQIIKADGTLVGENFLVSTDPANTDRKYIGAAKRIQQYADIVYDPDRNRFMVVFEDDRDGVNEKTATGQEISSHPCSQQYDRLNLNIYGAFFDTSGRPIGNNFPVSTIPNTAERYPEVTYDPVDKQFLVVWQSAIRATAVQPTCPPTAQLPAYPNDWIKVLGQRINQNGEKTGPLLTFENNARIHNQYSHNEMAPQVDVAFDNTVNKYLVTWGVTLDPTGVNYGFNVYKSYVNPDITDNSFSKIQNNMGGNVNRVFFKNVNGPAPFYITRQTIAQKQGLVFRIGNEGTFSNCPKDGGSPITTLYPTPTVTNPTPTTGCTTSSGDADKSGNITINDYEIWRKEFLRIITSKFTDFNCSGQVDINDYEVWRSNFLISN